MLSVEHDVTPYHLPRFNSNSFAQKTNHLNSTYNKICTGRNWCLTINSFVEKKKAKLLNNQQCEWRGGNKIMACITFSRSTRQLRFHL